MRQERKEIGFSRGRHFSARCAVENLRKKRTLQCLDYEELSLPTLIASPTRVLAAGNKPKIIDEYIGRLNNHEKRISVAHMRSPAGWQEPGQKPEFDEFTLVLRGCLRVRHKDGVFEVRAGQAVVAHVGEWVQYSTPTEGAEYVAICLPAFSLDTVHRDPKLDV